ncbi:MAG: hypothetical protein KAH25_11025 [Bacteroidales bacterium]|nr:hypothetical protein [Bacteroidales bacterium]
MYKIVRKEKGKYWDRIVLDIPLKPFSYASQKEIFDYCIKERLMSGENYLPGTKLVDKDDSNFGFYLTRYKRFYDRYLSEKLKIETILSSEIRKQFDEGKGSEFKSGKFYSVASSSRFAVSSFSEKSNQGIIELLKRVKINGKIENVKIKLEEGLNIEGISNNRYPPQMDVIVKTDSADTNFVVDTYFVEVKCHEICDTSQHKNIKLKWKYRDTESFRKIKKLITKNIAKKNVKENNSEKAYISINDSFLNAKSFDCELATTHFDFKQFLCHLMGILSYKKNNPSEKVHFYYLYYKNEEYFNLTKGKKKYSELEAEMAEVFGKFGKLFKEIDFGYCYNNKFDTLENLMKENI